MPMTMRRRRGQKQKKERNIFMTKPGDLPATNWEEEYKKEHKLRQEVEGELSIVKTITIDASPEMRDAKKKIEELQNNSDRLRKENSECYNRIADLTESLKSKDYWQDPDYKFLIDENKKLHAENKKLHTFLEKRIDGSRKSGM